MKYFRKLTTCLFCCCLYTTLTAQPLNIDSLEQALTSAKSTDAEKTDLLLNLCQVYLQTDTAKCRAYAMEALKLAQKSGSKLAEAKAYIALGVHYSYNFFPYQAHAHYIRAEKIFLELDDKERLYVTYYNLMTLFGDLKEDDNATYYANKIQAMAAGRKDWIQALNAQVFIGDARFRNHQGQEALDYFLNLYHRALHIEDSLGIRHELSSSVGIRCASIYFDMNRHHEALPYLHKCLVYGQSNDLTTIFGVVYGNLALAHALMHNVDSAEYYINKAMDSHMLINHIHQVYLASAKVDSIKGNYLSALTNFQKYHHIVDSLSKEAASTEMARLKVWHEFDQRDFENRLLQQKFHDQQKQTLVLKIALVMILALLALAVFFYRKTTEKNREMKKLHAVKDKLFSVVAHDLRNPMSALMSVLKLANGNMPDVEKQNQLFKDISSRVNHTYDLLDNLLGWTKSQMRGIVSAPVYFDAQEESRSVTDSLQAIASNKQIVLENRIEPQQVYADRDMFDVVVRNLTTNAIKYTSAGGGITLSSELSGNMLVISVKDTGTGMSQEVQDKLFNLSETKSQRGTDNESGTGLGLVLCSDFTKANGGCIWFTSVHGEGSTFSFSVPVND